MAIYTVLAVVATFGMYYWRNSFPLWLELAVNTLVVLAFVAVIIKRDLPLSSLPVVGKYFRRK